MADLVRDLLLAVTLPFCLSALGTATCLAVLGRADRWMVLFGCVVAVPAAVAGFLLGASHG